MNGSLAIKKVGKKISEMLTSTLRTLDKRFKMEIVS